MIKKHLIFLLMVLLVPFAFADPQGANVTAGANQTADNATAGAHNASGGNINELNLSVESQTQRWQGYYGEISGNITLEDEDGNKMYEWEVNTTQGEVYATRSSTTPDWSTVATTDITATDVDTFLSWPANASDNAVNTYTSDSNTEFDLAGTTITANSRDVVSTFDDTETGAFESILLTDDGGTLDDVIFATLIYDDATNFESGTSDFQLIVPEDNTDNSDTTTYYFYVELS